MQHQDNFLDFKIEENKMYIFHTCREEAKQIGMILNLKFIDLIAKDELEPIKNSESEKSYFSFPTHHDFLEFKQMEKRFFK